MLKLFQFRPLIIACVLAGFLLILKTCGGSSAPENEFEINSSASAMGTADKDLEADSPKDTIMALTAHLRNTQSQFRHIQQVQNKSDSKQEELKTNMSNMQNRQNALTESLENMTRQIKNLSNLIDSTSGKLKRIKEVGLKINNDEFSDLNISKNSSRPDYVIYKDISQRRSRQKSTRVLVAATGKQENSQNLPLLVNADSAGGKDRTSDLSFISAPVLTIPENTTLVNATLFTALLGRIPVNGIVDDPFPFTVLVGRANLAAMGFNIPGVRGMIMRGRAKGDLTLSCVTGAIISATFIFDDGGIRTLHGSTGSPLAVIEDKQGLPCVPGRLISNASKFITTRSLLGGIEGATRAGAMSEITSSVGTNSGTVTSAVTGNSRNFMLNNMGNQAANDSVSWWNDRNKQSFDVIFVKPGTKIALSIHKEMRIDRDKQGRKIIHNHQNRQMELNQTSLD